MKGIGHRLVDVHLHGPLADKFGPMHSFAINNPSEAVAALDANFPGFIAAFNENGHYAIYADGDWRDGDEAAILPVSKELHLVPLIEGRAFVGAALVGALIPAIAGTAAATIIGGLLISGLLFGISLLLTPKVKKPAEATKDENYAFSGPENVTQQGAAVPLIYGRVHAGTVVVSAGLELDVEYAAGPASYPTLTSLMSFASDEDSEILDDGPVTMTARSTAVAPNARAPRAGWPPLMQGPYGLQPKGWDFAAKQIFGSRSGSREASIFIAPNNTGDVIYAWSEIAGFYSFSAGITLAPEAYQKPEGEQPE